MRLSALWALRLACARTEMAACCRMEFLVNVAVSLAISTSRIRLCAADRFSTCTPMLLIVEDRRFWTAPKEPRRVETESMAVSIAAMAADGLPVEEMLSAFVQEADTNGVHLMVHPEKTYLSFVIFKEENGYHVNSRNRGAASDLDARSLSDELGLIGFHPSPTQPPLGDDHYICED